MGVLADVVQALANDRHQHRLLLAAELVGIADDGEVGGQPGVAREAAHVHPDHRGQPLLARRRSQGAEDVAERGGRLRRPRLDAAQLLEQFPGALGQGRAGPAHRGADAEEQRAEVVVEVAGDPLPLLEGAEPRGAPGVHRGADRRPQRGGELHRERVGAVADLAGLAVRGVEHADGPAAEADGHAQHRPDALGPHRLDQPLGDRGVGVVVGDRHRPPRAEHPAADAVTHGDSQTVAHSSLRMCQPPARDHQVLRLAHPERGDVGTHQSRRAPAPPWRRAPTHRAGPPPGVMPRTVSAGPRQQHRQCCRPWMAYARLRGDRADTARATARGPGRSARPTSTPEHGVCRRAPCQAEGGWELSAEAAARSGGAGQSVRHPLLDALLDVEEDVEDARREWLAAGERRRAGGCGRGRSGGSPAAATPAWCGGRARRGPPPGRRTPRRGSGRRASPARAVLARSSARAARCISRAAVLSISPPSRYANVIVEHALYSHRGVVR